jgi:hypothetical protein
MKKETLRSVSKRKISDDDLIRINRFLIKYPETNIIKLVETLNLHADKTTINRYINALEWKKIVTKYSS